MNQGSLCYYYVWRAWLTVNQLELLTSFVKQKLLMRHIRTREILWNSCLEKTVLPSQKKALLLFHLLYLDLDKTAIAQLITLFPAVVWFVKTSTAFICHTKDGPNVKCTIYAYFII